MKTVIYLRKSRADTEAESRGEGETLARHEKILLEVAKKQKLQIIEIYREIVSGETISSRPVVQKLLSEVEQGMWEAVLVVEVERLGRGDTIDQGIVAQAFKYSNTKIITPLKIYDPSNEFDEEFFEFGLFMSRREYKTINRRLQQGRTQSVKEGKYTGNIAPYGYKRQKLEKEKGFTLVPDENEAPIVKMIFDLYTKGDNGKRIGVSLIVRKLNELKILARKGAWTNASIQTIIRNPAYIGKVRWGARKTVKKVVDGQIVRTRPRATEYTIVDGKHVPLVDEETFRLANEYIDTNRARPNPSQSECTNPLSGIIECAICGHKMVRRPYKKVGQEASLICPYTHCNNVSSPLHLVENNIIVALKELYESHNIGLKKNKKSTTCSVDLLEKTKLNIIKEIDILNNQTEKAHDLLEQSVYDIDTFLSRTKSISEKITSLKNDLLNIDKEIEKIKVQAIHSKDIMPAFTNIINNYYSLKSAEEKNDLLKIVLEKVVYLKENKGKRGRNPNNFSIKLIPRIQA